MKLKHQNFKIEVSILFLFIVLSTNLQSQIINGSFENVNSMDELIGWKDVCPPEPSRVINAAPGGGNYCMENWAGNYQGCFHEYAYQFVPSMKNGEIWKVEGWAKSTGISVGIYLGAMDSTNNISSSTLTKINQATTDSTEWTYISVEDTVFLTQNETAVVLLFAGVTTGAMGGVSYFDMISAQKTGDINNINLQPSEEIIEIYVFPNPFKDNTTMVFENDSSKPHFLILYDNQGQAVRTINNITTGKINIERLNLSSGLYFYRLFNEKQKFVLGKLIIK
jgi:hypothetical protein